MTNKSLKIDMTKPENRYALIIDYYRVNPRRAIDNSGRNISYFCDVVWSDHLLLRKRITETIANLVARVKDAQSRQLELFPGLSDRNGGIK